MVRPGSNGDLVPETVNVLGHSPSEGCSAITPEPLHVVRMGSAFEQGALLLKRLLVDLSLNARVDFVAQKHPVRTQFPVRQSLPESLAEVQQHLHRDIVLFDPLCHDRDFPTLVISIGRTMRLFAIFSGKRNEIPLRRYLRIAQPKGGNSSWRYALTLFALLLSQASLPTVHGQNAAPVTLSGPQLRVEVRSVNGRLEEKYQIG